jgi:hypothetical protein
MGNISHKRPEKVNFFYLHPMTFFEFLDAIGKSRYRNLLEDIETPTPLAEAFHSHLVDLLRFYYLLPPTFPNFLSFGIPSQSIWLKKTKNSFFLAANSERQSRKHERMKARNKTTFRLSCLRIFVLS